MTEYKDLLRLTIGRVSKRTGLSGVKNIAAQFDPADIAIAVAIGKAISSIDVDARWSIETVLGREVDIDSIDTGTIVAKVEDEPQGLIPLADYEIMRRKYELCRQAVEAFAEAFRGI